MRNLVKLLKQKTSTEFRWRGPGLGYAKEVVINGDHGVYHDALAPERVVELLTAGQEAMREFATAQGYTGLDDVEFYVEPGIYTVSVPAAWTDDALDNDMDVDVFRLIARMKKAC